MVLLIKVELEFILEVVGVNPWNVTLPHQTEAGCQSLDLDLLPNGFSLVIEQCEGKFSST